MTAHRFPWSASQVRSHIVVGTNTSSGCKSTRNHRKNAASTMTMPPSETERKREAYGSAAAARNPEHPQLFARAVLGYAMQTPSFVAAIALLLPACSGSQRCVAAVDAAYTEQLVALCADYPGDELESCPHFEALREAHREGFARCHQ